VSVLKYAEPPNWLADIKDEVSDVESKIVGDDDGVEEEGDGE
jgi:hypothetical protein